MRDGEAVGKRAVVETDRATIAEASEGTQGRTATDIRQSSADGNHLCAKDRNPVGVVAPRDGLWKRDDLLAAVARVAGSGRVGAITSGDIAGTARWREDRLEPSLY